MKLQSAYCRCHHEERADCPSDPRPGLGYNADEDHKENDR